MGTYDVRVVHLAGNEMTRSLRRRMTLLASALAVASVSTAPGAALPAQSRATSAVRGFVVGEDGAPVAEAAVLMRHDETGATRSGLTNEEGVFLLLSLAPGGPYTLTVQHIGFADSRHDGLALQVGEVHTLDIVLRTEAVRLPGLEVAVERAEVFDPGRIGPVTRLTERALESTPILSRDVMELAALSPLVKTTASGGFSVAGQNDRYNAILIDGLLSKDLFGLTSGGVPAAQGGAKLIPIDAVSQYEVLVAPFDVRLSGFTGGVMNAVTRSGTNDWRMRAAAVHRDEAFIGDLTLPTGPVEASGVDRSLVALSVGGPLVRDRGHVFVSGEFEARERPPTGFNLFRDAESLIRISEASIDRFAEVFRERHGADPGNPSVYPLDQRLANVFARGDWTFPGGSRVTVRNVFAHAANDEEPNRTAFQPYELSSNAVFRSSTSNILSAQLFSVLEGGHVNELDLTWQRISDATTPASPWPQIEVELPGTLLRREARAGGQFYAQQNDLDQWSLRLTNSLDLKRGEDVLTLGATGSYYDIGQLYLPGARGEYYFPSLFDWEDNWPYRYQRTELAEGEDERVGFQVIEWGAFAQHRLHAGRGLTMRFGLRLDVPHVLGKPSLNPEVLNFFGYDTSTLPSANYLLSPRFGFNWQSQGRRRTQVRVGFGWFAGQIPYVWLSNAFHNDGLRSVTYACLGRWYLEPRPLRPAPPLDLDSTPQSCYDPERNTGPPPFQELRSVVVFDPAFRFPQDLKFSLGVDRDLTDGVSASLGVLFNRAIDQVAVQELNLRGGQGGRPVLGGEGRRYYAPLTDDFDQVLVVTNDGEDGGVSVTAEVQGTLADRLGFRLGYALARSWDRMSLVFTDMQSNLGLNPVEYDVNAPPLRASNFDRPHKIVGAVFGAPVPGSPDTEVSLLYTGQSGAPFSFVYGGDVNGDGYPGLGAALDRDNDLILVPADLLTADYTIATKQIMAGALEQYDCLAAQRGRILRRNSCRAPFEHHLDLRVAHRLSVAGTELRFEADLVNVLNLLDGDWGVVETSRSVLPLLDLCELDNCGLGDAAIWSGAVLPTRNEDDVLRPADPWNAVSPASQWQLQLGVRATLGGTGG